MVLSGAAAQAQQAPAPTAPASPATLPAPPPANGRIRLKVEPVTDGALLATSFGFWGTMELVLSTGEIRPQQIDPDFITDNLLFLDRVAVDQTIDTNADLYSSVGLYSAVGFAGVDVILSSFRDGPTAGIVDGTLYLEAVSMAMGMTDLAKVAVRRPRPIAYIERQNYIASHGAGSAAQYNNASTDSALSFVSGHAAVTSSIASVATYLAFARSPDTARPWITLAVGIALTSFVGYERVRAGAHFPTDVISGAVAG